MKLSRIVAVLAVLMLIFSGYGTGTSLASGKAGVGSHSTTHIKYRGTTSLKGQNSGSAGEAVGNEVRSGPEVDEEAPHQSSSNGHVPAAHVPRPAGNPVTTLNPGFTGFDGLTHRDQRLADNGNQFSLEPPDQALCVGNSYVLEGVNDALAVYSPTGSVLSGPTSLNRFYDLPSAIVRNPDGAVYGPFISDPKCYYDPDTARWFVTALELDVDPATGAFTGGSHTEIAVSKTSDPTGQYYLYSIDTTDNGTNGTPSHPGCPCLGDQPLIGADKYGFYITTNEFPLFTSGFNGAEVYAVSKTDLEDGGDLPPVVHISNIPLAESIAYSIQPATTPPGGTYELGNGGTEYFLSALQFSAKPPLDNRIATWALTNTSSLNTDSPNVTLTNTVIGSEVYGQPPDAEQKAGPMPLGSSLKDKLEYLAGNDDRMNQVVYADGKLWSGVNTVVKPKNGPTDVGIAYFIVSPSVANGQVQASMAKQGYVMVQGQNVLYPSIGVNSLGQGVMTFTLSGPRYYPSAAYAKVDAVNGAGPVHIAAAGALPEDGFSGYPEYGGNGTARWGDYSAAVADEDGSIWIATEYIPNAPRTELANWGTFVGHVLP